MNEKVYCCAGREVRIWLDMVLVSKLDGRTAAMVDVCDLTVYGQL